MCSVVCPVRLDEVNGIEHVVFDVFWGRVPTPRAQVAICAGGFDREAV